MISFVFSNPRHHAEILLPVVRRLQTQGQPCRVISMAELRGMTTPTWDLAGAKQHSLLPVRRPFRVPPPDTGGETNASPKRDYRGVLQNAVYRAGIGPRLRWLLRGSGAVVVPNDAAFPYLQLVRSLAERHVPFVLVQEGIRFKLPSETSTAYGKNGAASVCVWGTGSAEHFTSIGVPSRILRVTGNPRFDHLETTGCAEEGRAILAGLGVQSPPLLFLSNPIETQGYCSNAEKLELFGAFLREAIPVTKRLGVPIVVKLHSYERSSEFDAIARQLGVAITLAHDAPLFPLLATARAAVVTASTVGLEALVFGCPLAVLKVPHHDYAFEYVQRGAAIGLAIGNVARGVEELLDHRSEGRDRAATALLDRHLAFRGTANHRIGEAILSVAHAL